MILASGHNTPDFSSCLGAGMYGGGLGGVGGGGGGGPNFKLPGPIQNYQVRCNNNITISIIFYIYTGV